MKEPVDFKIVKLLTEKGFEERAKSYNEEGKLVHVSLTFRRIKKERIYYPAPSISELISWFFEKHGIWIQTAPAFEYNEGSKDYLNFQGFQYFITIIQNNKHGNNIADRELKLSPTESYNSAFEYILTNDLI